jgi:hypothetical protein
VRITEEIAREPTDGKRFEFPILVFSRWQATGQVSLFVACEHSNDGDERMREFRVVSAVLIRKRNYEIALARKGTITKARSNFSFDSINDLRIQRHIIVRKIDISRLRHQGIPKKQKEDSEVHVREVTSNGFHGKTLVCRSDYDHEHELATAMPSGG